MTSSILHVISLPPECSEFDVDDDILSGEWLVPGLPNFDLALGIVYFGICRFVIGDRVIWYLGLLAKSEDDGPSNSIDENDADDDGSCDDIPGCDWFNTSGRLRDVDGWFKFIEVLDWNVSILLPIAYGLIIWRCLSAIRNRKTTVNGNSQLSTDSCLVNRVLKVMVIM